MKITIMTSLPAEGDMNVNSGHPNNVGFEFTNKIFFKRVDESGWNPLSGFPLR